MNKFAGIIINSDSEALDRIFTYEVPQELQDEMQIGYRVKVPFGKGNRWTYGFVIELFDVPQTESKVQLKKILKLCDGFPVLDEKDISLMEEMRNKFICTRLECIKAILPSGVLKDVKNKIELRVCVGKPLEGKHLKEPYTKIYDVVKMNDGKFNRSELAEKFDFSVSSVNTMIKHDYLRLNSSIVNRFNERSYSEYQEKNLNEDQKHAVDSILSADEGEKFLIHGITGSGKTEVYMKLVSEMMKRGKDSIILVPEISLTPQMVERFKGRFGKDIAVFHSKLSDGERYDEWMRVKQGKVKVAIGARSAMFLPFKNLGLIVIDEEHEGSYKSDSDPKYNAREVAEMKCKIEGCKLVLGSATPSLETYYRMTRGEFHLISMKKRADGASMPKVNIVDMREELMNGNKSMFSRALQQGIESRLERKEQIILFLNRRGFSTFVSCRKCGHVFKCDKCDISLTYHSGEQSLKCHYCGKKTRVPNSCPSCGSKYVKYFGVGTEKVETEIKRCYPSARVIRMDFDTTRRKNSYEEIYNDFKNGNADILIGTQMIAKGLDFKNVTLVGVIAADLSLNLPDFRASERTFQLLAQVSGRAGRGQKEGEVVVQTYSPDEYSIICASEHDFEKYFQEEIQIRYNMNYPPFSRILLINMSSKNENLLIKSMQKIGIMLKDKLNGYDKIHILGPCPCEIAKIKENHRWQILIKGEFDNLFAKNVKNLIYENMKDVYNEVRVSLDVNPNSLL